MNFDEKVINYWNSDVCRCCLSSNAKKDLMTTYIHGGDKEVYCDMLKECFEIIMSQGLDWEGSKAICSKCVSQLRIASNFKRQVLKAESHFIRYCNTSESSNDVSMKWEKEPSSVSGYLFNDVIKKSHTKFPEKNVLKKHTVRKRRKIIVHDVDTTETNDFDSDTPISEITNKNVRVSTTNNYNHGEASKISAEHITHSDESPTGVPEGYQHDSSIKPAIKPISERKRIMLTCGIVLRNTTACPFRHHKSWFQCFFCSQDFMELNLLRNHTTKMHDDIEIELRKIKRYPRSLQIDISKLECRHCSLDLTDVDMMRRHLDDVHNKVIYKECIADFKVNSSPYSCHLCKREFHVFRSLTTHLNEHYANCICDVCGKSFINSKRLKVHKRTHENGHYPCTKCGKILKTKISKANHIESVHSKRTIKCQICLKPMKHYNDRIKHMSDMHNITHKFKCPICSREYNIKHYLATHIRQTHGHKNKKCTECGMAFVTNHGLKKHMLKHCAEKPHKCSVCGKTYTRSYTLKEHLRSHDSEKRLLNSQ